ncbi:MAG: hypothetical protein RLZZ59_467 [Pseudomonadota bacterium]
MSKHTFNGFNDGEFSLEDNFEHLAGAEFVLAFEEKYGVEYADSGKYTGVDLTSISQNHIEHLRVVLFSMPCIGPHPLEDLVKDWNLEHLTGTEFVLAFEERYGVEYADSGKYTGVDLTSISQNHIEHLQMALLSTACIGSHPLEDLVKDWNLVDSQDASAGEVGVAQVSDARSHDITGKRQEMLFKLFENASGKENSFDTIIEHFCEKMGKEAGEFTPELLADYLDLMIQEFGL